MIGRKDYLLGPGISMVAQFPDAQIRSLTCGKDCPPFPELPTLIFDSTRLISGDWQEGQTGSIGSSLWTASSSKVLWHWSQQNS